MRPASRLTGLTINNQWHVVAPHVRPEDSTGGTFSVGYVVEGPEGQKGFLKAIDFADALKSLDPARKLQEITSAFLFERDVCDACAKRSFDNVVVAWTHGRVQIDDADPFSVVQYIIFELANGDIRSHLDRLDSLDLAWQLRAIHHITVGLQQLHSVDVAHQDVKPSNVLIFGGTTSKLADLGRAASKHLPSPFDGLTVAGDLSYAPPEQLFGYAQQDWNFRRLGCDLYLLGSMILFMFSRITMTASVLSHLPPDFHPSRYQGTFQHVLPYLRHAVDKTISALHRDVPESVRDDVCRAVAQLCDPDPQLRGHPEQRGRAQNPHGLERYVALFDLLATRAHYNRRAK